MKNFSVGQKSLDVFKTIVENNEINEIKVISHKVGLNWSQKFSSDEERKKYFLEAYAYSTKPINTYIFSKEDFLKTNLGDIKQTLDSEVALSIVSKVKTIGGEEMHVPMMNFHPEGGFGIFEIKKSINQILPKVNGVLLNSGRHYHYYGNCLLNQRDWEKFLGNFLIPFNLVHPGHIGYRLTDGYSTLRLTAATIYKSKVPEVIELL